MSNAFADAIMSSMSASLDPNAKLVSEYGTSMVQTMQANLIDRKSESIESIERKLTDAKDRNAPVAVINAYEKLLAKLTS